MEIRVFTTLAIPIPVKTLAAAGSLLPGISMIPSPGVNPRAVKATRQAKHQPRALARVEAKPTVQVMATASTKAKPE